MSYNIDVIASRILVIKMFFDMIHLLDEDSRTSKNRGSSKRAQSIGGGELFRHRQAHISFNVEGLSLLHLLIHTTYSH